MVEIQTTISSTSVTEKIFFFQTVVSLNRLEGVCTAVVLTLFGDSHKPFQISNALPLSLLLKNSNALSISLLQKNVNALFLNA